MKIKKKNLGEGVGGGVGWGGGQGGCEWRSEAFVKILKKKNLVWGGVIFGNYMVRGWVGLGERRIEAFVKIKKNYFFFLGGGRRVGGGGWSGWM